MVDLLRGEIEDAQRLTQRVSIVRQIGADPRLLPELRPEGGRPDHDLRVVQRRGFAELRRVHLVAHGVVHDSDAQLSVHAQRDRDREERQALREVEAAADRIDDPQALGVDRERLVLGPFLGDDPVVRTLLFQDVDDEVLDLDRAADDDIATPTPLQVAGRSEIRARKASRAERSACRELARGFVVHQHVRR